MKTIIDVAEYPGDLDSLVQRVSRGEEVVLARGGEPVAEIVAVEGKGPRKRGLAKGRIRFAPDFDAPLADLDDYR